MSDSRLEALRAAAAEEVARAPVATPWWHDALKLVALNLGSGVLGALAMTWNTTQHESPFWRWAVAALGLLLSGFGAVLALHPGWRGLRRLFALGVVLVVTGTLLGASGLGSLGGASCGLIECVVALVPAAGALAFLSRFAPDFSRALVAGAAAGAGGLVALHLHCPNGSAGHLVLFHLLPWVAMAGLVAWVRLKTRSRTFAP